MFERPFTAYTYSYPHKTAYRSLGPFSLADLWADENRDSLFLYLHVPFCEFRCGFCNLFTHARPEQGLSTRYLVALRRQAETVREAIPDAQFVEMAVGGGTPTYLNNDELVQLFEIITDVMGGQPDQVPVSFEASPATIDRDKLRLLKQLGVDRLSLGVQSFDHKEAHSIGRPEKPDRVRAAMEALVEADFERLNIDLIYGGQGQTINQWISSVDQAISYQPEEIFLYPLYVRELTGLDQVGTMTDLSLSENDAWDQQRLVAYREAKDRLLASDYQQKSLRIFQRRDHNESKRLGLARPLSGSQIENQNSIYRCQDDGMVGLGSGARSYTSRVHYSTEYAVNSKAVLGIIHDYLKRDKHQFSKVDYGIELKADDQKRRFVILSLLMVDGLSRKAYRQKFGDTENDVLDDLPELADLVVHSLATINQDRIVLTDAGIEWSDAIGPWLYSHRVHSAMEAYLCR